MESLICSRSVVDKIGKPFVFLLLAVFVQTGFMGCHDVNDYTVPDEDTYWPIPEIGDAKAYVTISPLKDAYKIGDTIKCVLRADKKDWNDWDGFNKAVFQVFLLNFFDGKIAKRPDPLPEISKRPTEATALPNGESYVEQVSFYKLTESGDLLVGSGFLYPHEAFQLFQYWQIHYDGTDGRRYRDEVPVYFKHTGKRGVLIKVVE